MKEFEILLEKRWVLKSENKDLYYRLRDASGEIRKITSEKMGCKLIENALLIKLEKIPVIAEAFMGVQEFSSKEEYGFLCVVLMFLEDKDAGEQFILSQLTEYIEINMPGEHVDWTVYTNRRRLVKVLRYAISQEILKITDGSDEAFMDSDSGEVLYESTGASRYFMRSFSKDIMSYSKVEDFSKGEWFDIDEDKGVARRQRVYKRLLFAPGMYRVDGFNEDFDYLKNYGRRLNDEFEKYLDCKIHIHKGSAYIVLGEDCHIGKSFPAENLASDIVLLILAELKESISNEEWHIEQDETLTISDIELEQIIRSVKRKYDKGFAKKYRQMTDGEFLRSITNELEYWTFIKKTDYQGKIRLYPSVGKLRGRYPEEFLDSLKGEKTGNEQ